jgi:hypothetical protein
MSAWSRLRHTSDRIEILRSDVEGERIRLHAPTTFKRLRHGVVLGVSEYLPISVPAPPVPRTPQWYRERKRPRSVGAARDRADRPAYRNADRSPCRLHHAFFFGRPRPRFTLAPVPLAALVVFAEPLPASAG